MDTPYLQVQAAGFSAYSDALVARVAGAELQACFLSIIGTPSNVKALSAILYGGETCRITHPADFVRGSAVSPGQIDRELGFPEGLRTWRTRKIGEIVNKILVSTDYSEQSAFVYGPNMHTIRDRAFLFLNAATPVPLKPEWRNWLWDEVLHPEKLYSFGREELQEAYLVSWPETDILLEKVLEGIAMDYLT